MLLVPSMLARFMVQKFRFGMLFVRQEDQLEADDIGFDRGNMTRSIGDVGLRSDHGACHVDDARKNALCLSTDATGES